MTPARDDTEDADTVLNEESAAPREGVCMSESGRLRAPTGMLVMAGVCLLGATPASAADGTGIGSGRLVPTVAAVVGLIGVVLGGLALARSRRTADRLTG